MDVTARGRRPRIKSNTKYKIQMNAIVGGGEQGIKCNINQPMHLSLQIPHIDNNKEDMTMMMKMMKMVKMVTM